jgi:hypothetical protein
MQKVSNKPKRVRAKKVIVEAMQTDYVYALEPLPEKQSVNYDFDLRSIPVLGLTMLNKWNELLNEFKAVDKSFASGSMYLILDIQNEHINELIRFLKYLKYQAIELNDSICLIKKP